MAWKESIIMNGEEKKQWDRQGEKQTFPSASFSCFSAAACFTLASRTILWASYRAGRHADRQIPKRAVYWIGHMFTRRSLLVVQGKNITVTPHLINQFYVNFVK